jgi:hypothetical protein
MHLTTISPGFGDEWSRLLSKIRFTELRPAIPIRFIPEQRIVAHGPFNRLMDYAWEDIVSEMKYAIYAIEEAYYERPRPLQSSTTRSLTSLIQLKYFFSLASPSC